MDVSLDVLVRLLAQNPLLLLVFYCAIWMLPRSMSILLGFATGGLIAYSLLVYSDLHWQRLHYWLTLFDITPIVDSQQLPEDHRDTVERAYTRGCYHALVLCGSLLVALLPGLAHSRVEETISNIGRRPPQGKRPPL